MIRGLLIAVATTFVATGAYIFIAPMSFYTTVPGVEMLGPFSVHFIRDAGLAYLAGGACMIWGALKHERGIAVAGAIWPCLHALFHAHMWISRGFPADFVAVVNLVGIQAPAWLALFLALRISKTR